VSLSNDGNTVAIGAPLANENRGWARVYRHNGTDWIQLGNIIQLIADAVYLEVCIINWLDSRTSVLKCTIAVA
jgi:hypothetical protein